MGVGCAPYPLERTNMAKRIIELTVSDEYVIGGGVPIGAAGSHDDVVLRMAFGEMWTGLNIYATFTEPWERTPRR